MSELARFGVSLEKDLLESFDERIKLHSYETRSKAIADLIKSYIESEAVSGDGLLAGTVSFLYDHHNKDLVAKLLDIQHDEHDIIISMQHIHLDHHTCLEVLAVRGNAENIRTLYHNIRAMKGVKLATISVITV